MSEEQNYNMTPEFFSQVSESIKSVFDITSRIDERVKIIMEKQTEFDRRLTNVVDHLNNLSSRVTVLEARDEREMKDRIDIAHSRIVDLEKQVQIIQLYTSNTENKWKTMGTFVFQVVLAVITAYIAFRIGIEP